MGNAGCPVHPQPRVRSGSAECTRVFTAVAPEITRHPRTQWFTAYFVISPAIGLFCHRRRQRLSCRLDASVEASGPHDLAVRKPGALVSRAARVHRIPPRVCDDGQRPSVGLRLTPLERKNRCIFNILWIRPSASVPFVSRRAFDREFIGPCGRLCAGAAGPVCPVACRLYGLLMASPLTLARRCRGDGARGCRR